MKGLHDSLAAADALAKDGIDCEVIDLRTIKPLDIETVIASVERTTRLLVVEEGPLSGGWAGEVMARVTEQALGSLDDAWRLATADTPIPYSPPLEDAFLPGTGAIIQSVKERSA
jgi:acetoin:2,6-dichlorophenolindophenol oxidoreductase subunit beta